MDSGRNDVIPNNYNDVIPNLIGNPVLPNMDSRFRGNDVERVRNDVERIGNDVERIGNDVKGV
jgi:hypothetical protein